MTVLTIAATVLVTVPLSDLEAPFACKACGKRGADVRPNFNWNARGPVGGMGYRVVVDP
jgi:hypothetical protein